MRLSWERTHTSTYFPKQVALPTCVQLLPCDNSATLKRIQPGDHTQSPRADFTALVQAPLTGWAVLNLTPLSPPNYQSIIYYTNVVLTFDRLCPLSC